MRALGRVRTRASSQLVRVEHDGVLLAESRRPLLLFETAHPTRYYLPREDVRLDALEPSETVTHCPYKGDAEHFARGGVDVAWSYPDPIADVPEIAGLIAFYPRRVDVTVSPPEPEAPSS